MRKSSPVTIGLISLLLCHWAFPESDVGQATIVEVQGQIKVLRGGDSAKAEPGQTGLKLRGGDVVKVGVGSAATIDMGSGNTMLLKANSTLKIGNTPRSPRLDLLGGKLLNRLRKIPKGEKVEIGTPTSIAGVEGTTFAVTVSDKGATEVDVLKGSVRVQSTGEPDKFASVTAMQRVRVSNWRDTFFVATGSGIAPERYKRPRITEEGKEVFVVRAGGTGRPASDATTAEEKTASAEASAKDAALHELAERVLRASITEEETVGDLASKDPKIYEKISALAATAAVDKQQILEDGSARVTVELRIADLNAALGLAKPVFTGAMVQISAEQYTRIFTPRARLTAEQAAKTVADRGLLEQIQGIMLSSETTVQDFSLQDDRVASKVEGVIRGAETIRTVYLSDGTVEMTRRVKGTDVRISIDAVTTKKTLGMRYMGRPIEIDPIRYAALRQFNEP